MLRLGRFVKGGVLCVIKDKIANIEMSVVRVGVGSCDGVDSWCLQFCEPNDVSHKVHPKLTDPTLLDNIVVLSKI
jgi:hypothetical protein